MQHWWYTKLYLQRTPLLTDQRQSLAQLSEQLIRAVVAPLAAHALQERWIDRFFFLHYADPRMHLRVRMRTTGDSAAFAPAAAAHIERFFAAHAADLGLAAAPSWDELTRQGWVQVEQYVPELVKYGGPAGAALAEQAFMRSSQIAIDLLSSTPQRSERALRAMELIAALCRAYGSPPQSSALLLKSHSAYWLGRLLNDDPSAHIAVLEQKYQQQRAALGLRLAWLDAAVPAPRYLDAWSAFHADHWHQFRQLERSPEFRPPTAPRASLAAYPELAAYPSSSLVVLPNYIHLLCNRIGLAALQEAQLAYMLARIFEERSAPVAALYPLQLEFATAELSRAA